MRRVALRGVRAHLGRFLLSVLAVLLAGAGVAGHFVLLFLYLALMWGLSNLVGLAWSSVIVAVLWAVIAGILAAMGVDPDAASCAVRVSFGPSTSAADINRFFEEWRRMRRRGKAEAA